MESIGISRVVARRLGMFPAQPAPYCVLQHLRDPKEGMGGRGGFTAAGLGPGNAPNLLKQYGRVKEISAPPAGSGLSITYVDVPSSVT